MTGERSCNGSEARVAVNVELFVGLAGIAGVFVGFGALISFSRPTEMADRQLVQIRAVVAIGLLAMLASLVPIGLNSLGLEGRSLWVVSSVSFLVMLWTVGVRGLLREENRAQFAAWNRDRPVVFRSFWLLIELPMHVLLILVILPVLQDLDQGLYTVAILLQLAEGASVLTQLVYSVPATPS